MSVFTAWVYNIIYFVFLGGWLWQLFDMTETEIEETGAFDILLNMFFIYNCIHNSLMDHKSLLASTQIQKCTGDAESSRKFFQRLVNKSTERKSVYTHSPQI